MLIQSVRGVAQSGASCRAGKMPIHQRALRPLRALGMIRDWQLPNPLEIPRSPKILTHTDDSQNTHTDSRLQPASLFDRQVKGLDVRPFLVGILLALLGAVGIALPP